MNRLLLFLIIGLLAAPSFANVDIVVETNNPTAAMARVHSLGITDKDLIALTPAIVDVLTGVSHFNFRIPDDRAHVIPAHNNPTFSVLWREDELCGTEEDPVICPWPMVTVERDEYDENGDPTGGTVQFQQGVGRIL